jgi:geranylgeranyl pyrophosphate synthase
LFLSEGDFVVEDIFARELQIDLHEVDELFKKSLLPWWDDIANYVYKMTDDKSFNMLPAVVLAAYRKLGIERDLSLKMANMFKTMHLASRIHVLVKDDEEGQKVNQEMQFTILIGDYIFGKVLSLLYEYKVDMLLNIFATMICDINEGLIVEYKLDGSPDDVLARTKAPLYSSAFLTAAELAGLSQEKKDTYGLIGHNLGMALELKYIHGQNGLGYLEQAEQLLAQFPRGFTADDPVLENIMRESHN